MVQGSWIESATAYVTEAAGSTSTADRKLAAITSPLDHVALAHVSCRLPKVQLVRSKNDQRVPVYWDQTVPEWRGANRLQVPKVHDIFANAAYMRSREAGTCDGIAGSSLSSCCTKSYPATSSCSGNSTGYGMKPAWNEVHGCDHHAADMSKDPSSEVSFEDILSMYQSSLMAKKCRQKKSCTRKDVVWRGLGRLVRLTHTSRSLNSRRRREWVPSSFAGRICLSNTLQSRSRRVHLAHAGHDCCLNLEDCGGSSVEDDENGSSDCGGP